MTAKARFGFSKAEKLCSQKAITELHQQGEAFLCYPLRCVYHRAEHNSVQVLISVPKRNHKRAVVRNLLKRRIREAYRLNKAILVEACIPLDISFQYISRDILEYNKIENAIKKSLTELRNRLTTTTD